VKKADACTEPGIQPNSTAPMWDSPAATTQCGALETDNLMTLQPMTGGLHQEAMQTTARYGMTPRLEVRWGLPGHIFQSGGASLPLNGTTDQWLGACFRFHDQGRWMPDMALDYAIKLPTANPAKGFGTGYTDHLVTFIASRDLGRTHVDFNGVTTIAGSAQGRDAAAQFGMALTRPITTRLLGTVEAYGGPQPGTTDRYGAVLAGGAWSIHPWLSLNGGYARAYTAGAPRQQYLIGFVYTMRPGLVPPRDSRLARMLGR
jgi:hypothetical protein